MPSLVYDQMMRGRAMIDQELQLRLQISRACKEEVQVQVIDGAVGEVVNERRPSDR